MRPARLCIFVSVFIYILTFCVAGQAKEPTTDGVLGKVDFAISCSAAAKQEFNHGIVLLHHMTYPQAKASFLKVVELDPTCAMAYWGVAMTLFQPLWPNRPGPAEYQQGRNAVQQAMELQPPTERERLFIHAAEAFFRAPDESDYWERIRHWESALERVHERFPEDPEAAAFYSLAHLATAPPGGNSLAHQNRAAVLLLSIYATNPVHPGSIHYLIHANDIRGREHENLDIIRKYQEIAPRNPHALHMPTHIFTRLGDWEGVIAGNLGAAEAALEHPAGDQGQYVWDEYPHALEYLLYAHLQRGDDQAAAAVLGRLLTTRNLQPTFKTAFNLSSMPARFALERGDWEAAAALVPRADKTLDWNRFPWPEAISWFARGLGAAHLGKLELAREAQARLQALEQVATAKGEGLFAAQTRILALAVDASILQEQGHRERAVAQMTAAAELELSTPKHPVTPAPTLPAQEMLGDLLMEQENPAAAWAAYNASLELYPGRFNSLLGAARAARALGDSDKAKALYADLLQGSSPTATRADLQEARKYVTGGKPTQP